MGDGSVGSSNHFVRPTGVVERAESVTDRRPRREQQRQQQQDASDRRRKEPPNPRRRRVYDLLFDEVDRLDSLSEQQRARVKENIRNHVVGAVPPVEPPAAPPPAPDEPAPPGPDAGHDETHAAERLLSDPQAEVPVDHDRIVNVAAPVHPHLPLTEAEENRLLAEQLRLCLAQHTERARKLAVYLHVLLSMHHGVRPTLVLDV
ncbi:hypothetical protein [Azospirillum sp.]|uniref:hypothetical protein n=1 Tax=Azospirillum sp. TaxID=34012 RepID=UPI003D70FD66